MSMRPVHDPARSILGAGVCLMLRLIIDVVEVAILRRSTVLRSFEVLNGAILLG